MAAVIQLVFLAGSSSENLFQHFNEILVRLIGFLPALQPGGGIVLIFHLLVLLFRFGVEPRILFTTTAIILRLGENVD